MMSVLRWSTPKEDEIMEVALILDCRSVPNVGKAGEMEGVQKSENFADVNCAISLC